MPSSGSSGLGGADELLLSGSCWCPCAELGRRDSRLFPLVEAAACLSSGLCASGSSSSPSSSNSPTSSGGMASSVLPSLFVCTVLPAAPRAGRASASMASASSMALACRGTRKSDSGAAGLLKGPQAGHHCVLACAMDFEEAEGNTSRQSRPSSHMVASSNAETVCKRSALTVSAVLGSPPSCWAAPRAHVSRLRRSTARSTACTAAPSSPVEVAVEKLLEPAPS
mmetsp:Transcript_55393/g.110087  ORF Transcript_55393/g.110087 Transcript_55393/m.110087 type:complete len:225 (-) Transcript_55393:642-1316(-)